jgi:hypothetical protein
MPALRNSTHSPPLVAGFFMRGRMGGMEQDELMRLGELAARLNADITETTAIIAESDDGPMKTLLAGSLADLHRAWLILDGRLRLHK